MSRDRMETVLRLRRLGEQQARARMGETAAAVHALEGRLAAATGRLEEHRDGASSLRALLVARTVGVGLREAVAACRDELAAAVAAHERAQDDWRVARAEERAVERLLERRRAAARAEALRKELAELDELALLTRPVGVA